MCDFLIFRFCSSVFAGDARRIMLHIVALFFGVLLFPPLCQAGAANNNIHIPGIYGGAMNSKLPTVTPSTVPIPKPGGLIYGATVLPATPNSAGGDNLTVNQSQSQAIIDWSNFNIGSSSSVYFNQQGNSTWVVLNRIWDNSPSQIYGRLSADGKVYLINQNGILFGPNSRINVNSLVASALNIRNIDFLNYYKGNSTVLPFYLETGTGTGSGDTDAAGNPYSYNGISYAVYSTTHGFGYCTGTTCYTRGAAQQPFTFNLATDTCVTAVSNFGNIQAIPDANSLGSVFFIAPLVENGGIINALSGQIGLVAGTGSLQNPVTLTYLGANKPLVIGMSDSNGGTAWNMNAPADNNVIYTGQLTADYGMVGMYGASVNQDGLIRSITAVRQNGSVELRATSGAFASVASSVDSHQTGITTGPNSVIESPISDSTTDTADYAYAFSGGKIFMGGLQTVGPGGTISSFSQPSLIALYGSIYAPSGDVEIGSFVTSNAAQRVYLDGNSDIDVSGLWINEPATNLLIEAQMNSIELQDAYAQKGGVLQGQTITFSGAGGSSIGNVSGEILAQLLTAQQKAINGGQINIYSTGGDIIVKQGAQLKFSGGGIHYSGGALSTTELVSGSKIYNISNAPANLFYNSILGSYAVTHKGVNYDVTDSWTGLFYGGGSSLNKSIAAFDQGGNAGLLGLYAATVVLDGELDGSVKQGLHQTVHTTYSSGLSQEDNDEALLLSMWSGTEMPSAGGVIIDTSTGEPTISTSINIQQDVPAQTSLGATTPSLVGQQTNISAKMLNHASLSSLSLSANANITIGPNANIVLLPGGSFLNEAILDSGSFPTISTTVRGGTFSAIASQIDVYGSVTVPAGTISLTTNYNSNIALGTEVFLATGSSLDVSGQKIDNSINGNKYAAGQIQGGSINIQDENQNYDSNYNFNTRQEDIGVFIQNNAVLDVSGGYQIGTKGGISGGNAGTLNIGSETVMLNGNIRGYSLAGNTGGTIDLAAISIVILGPNSPFPWTGFTNANQPVPTNLQGTLYLSDNYLAGSGFTNINLESFKDITIEPYAQLATSLVKLMNTQNSSGRVGAVHFSDGTDLTLSQLNNQWAYQAGQSSITAYANDISSNNSFFNYLYSNGLVASDANVNLIVPQSAVISTAPGGLISLTVGSSVGNSSATIAGTLNAPGGNITIKAGSLDITGQILAPGYNKPDTASTPKGFGYNYIPEPGGSVTLTATTTDLNLETGSVIDIRGSSVVANTLLSTPGTSVKFSEAGNPGSLELDYVNNLYWNGDIKGGGVDGVQGGTLTVSLINQAALLVSNGGSSSNPTTANAINLAAIIKEGFDGLTLRSQGSIQFSGTMDATLARQLILDAPEILSSGNDIITLRSPWIILENTSKYEQNQTPTPGNGQLTLSTRTAASAPLSTGWIDVIGGINFNGFQKVTLEAGRDIRLADETYTLTTSGSQLSGVYTQGQLWTAGNLVLRADRVYPTMVSAVLQGDGTYNTYDYEPSQFVLQAGVFDGGNSNNNVQGIVSILPSGYRAPGQPMGPIYSAGGALTVIATQGIDVEGTLAAPMGSIILTTAADQHNTANPNTPIAAGSSVHIANNAEVSTAGNAMVAYGFLTSDGQDTWEVYTNWTGSSIKSTSANVSGNLSTLFPNSVTITTDQATVGSGGTIDTSGGGSVFPLEWREDITGSKDPLLPANSVGYTPGNPVYSWNYTMNPSVKFKSSDGNTAYVVMSGNSIQLPGQEVYLNGGGGLSAGTYTLLPTQYAFLPGAYIIELQPGSSVLPGPRNVTSDGYPLVTGYTAVANTSIEGTAPQVYSVATAANIIKTRATYDGLDQTTTIGNGGSQTITANTTILNGTLKSGPLVDPSTKLPIVDPSTGQYYLAGNVYLSGTNIYVMPTIDNVLPTTGSLYVSADSLSGGGDVYLGGNPTQSTNTNSITVIGGSAVTAPLISLYANNTITVQAGASLYATGTTGEIDLKTSSTGTPTTIAPTVTVDGSLHARTFGVDTPNLIINGGGLQGDGGAITMKSSAIYFAGQGAQQSGSGFYITTDIWNKLAGFQDITFQSIATPSASGIFFQSNFALSASNSLTLDASQIVNNGNSQLVQLTAPTVTLMNSGLSSTNSSSSKAGSFIVNANNINVGGGVATGFSTASNNVLFANFGSITFNSVNDLTLIGKGSLTTGKADLVVNAARVTTASTNNPVATANFFVYTGSNYYNDFGINPNSSYNPNPLGTITITNSGGSQGTTSTSGGTLEFWGKSIDESGVIQVDAGTIRLVATGAGQSDGIFMGSGAQILAEGTAYAPGGQVTLQAPNGGAGITLAAGSNINVSAGDQGDAGTVTLSAATGGVSIASGTLSGQAKGGVGGSFVLDTLQLSDTEMSNLIGNLNSGGFVQSVNIRTHTGNMDIDTGQSLTAHNIVLTADVNSYDTNGNPVYSPLFGNVNVSGTIDASGSTGGKVEIYATNDLNIQSGGSVNAFATANGSSGGAVTLSSSQGFVNINSGTINVSGGSAGTPGTVYLRALRNGTNVNIGPIGGAIDGARAVYIEAVRIYPYDTQNLDVSLYDGTWFSDALTFYNAYTSTAPATTPLHLIPEIEVVNTGGNIIVDTAPDLTDTKYGGLGGVMTLLAAGNLNINQNLADYPSSKNGSNTTPITQNPTVFRDSWGINLVAGADTTSANYMSVQKNVTGNPLNGTLNIASGAVVYTEYAPIRFASAGDTVIGAGANAAYMIYNPMNYNIASYAGDIQGNVGLDLIMNGGAIQTATGSIDINIGRDLQLNTAGGVMGAIRTTGQSMANVGNSQFDPTQYWTYAEGGNITLNVGRSVGQLSNSGTLQTAASSNSWDLYYNMRNYIEGGSLLNAIFSTTSGDTINFSLNGIPYTAHLTDGLYGANPQLASMIQTALNNAVAGLGQGPIFTVSVITLQNNKKALHIQNTSTNAVSNFLSGDTYVAKQLQFTSSSYDLINSASPSYWAADYTGAPATSTVGNVANVAFYSTAGLATMGGGNLYVRAAGDFLAQAGTFGQADAGDNLSIYAGGNINGRFLNYKGTGTIHAAGNFGSSAEQPTIELGPSAMKVTAGGDINVGEVVNPTNASLNILQTALDWDLTYTANTSITLIAGGNLTYYGTTNIPFYASSYDSIGNSALQNLLPANVYMQASGGNIDFMSSIILAPSQLGNLTLSATGNIEGYTTGGANGSSYATIQMADIPTSYIYNLIAHGGTIPSTDLSAAGLVMDLSSSTIYYHGYFAGSGGDQNLPLHSGDTTPVTISAGQDIDGLNLWLPKMARITAGQDITDTWYSGQNVATTDVSTIIAGRNISLLYSGKLLTANQAHYYETGFNQAGPGSFIVEAGNQIDLGASLGITTSGNGSINNSSGYFNAINGGSTRYGDGYSALGIQGSSLYVIAGYTMSALQSPAGPADLANFIVDMGAFFDGGTDSKGIVQTGLIKEGTTIENDKSSGNGNYNADLQSIEQSIRTVLGARNSNATGNINMILSTIKTNSGKINSTAFGNAPMFIIAGGNVNVGRTVFPNSSSTTKQSTGIVTIEGGAINIFAVDAVNVNESRVSTTLGGDITIWSDQGSINAGRGSKTEVSVDANGDPVTGSGIRAVSFDPDGSGPIQAPQPGNVYVYAFRGVIDAGEAGIAGNNVSIGAEQVLNTQNISATGAVVGVPATAATTTIGSLSGTNSVTQSNQALSDAVGALGGTKSQADQMVDDAMMKWLDVKVIDFVSEDQGL